MAISGAAGATELSERQFRLLERIQGDLNDEKFDSVMSQTEAAWTTQNDSLATALYLQLRSQALQQLGKDAEAALVLEVLLTLDSLPDDRRLNIAISLGYLRMAQGNAQATIDILNDRLSLYPEAAPASAYALLAIACQTLERYRESLVWISHALGISEPAVESWLNIRMAAEYQLGEYRAAAQTLKKLISIAPDTGRYWLQLAGMYQLLGDNNRQLAVLELSDRLGLLSESDRKVMAGLMIRQGVPAKAVVALRTHSPVENKLLVQALRAGGDLAEAADLLVDSEGQGGDLWLAMQLYYAHGMNQKVIATADRYLSEDGYSERDRVLMLAGSAAIELADTASARRYFQMARNEPGVSAQAQQWLDYISALQLEELR